jgi:hypothetical protein
MSEAGAKWAEMWEGKQGPKEQEEKRTEPSGSVELADWEESMRAPGECGVEGGWSGAKVSGDVLSWDAAQRPCD